MAATSLLCTFNDIYIYTYNNQLFGFTHLGPPPPTPAASYCFSEVCIVSSHDAGHSFMALVWSHLSAFQLK